jgi:tetratricopeptide (TPR) repeat protein
MNILNLVGVVLVVLVALLVTAIAVLRARPQERLKLAEKLRAQGRLQEALKRFREVTQAIDLGKAPPAQRNALAVRAHISLAELENQMGNKRAAVAHYRRAKDFSATLSQEALLLWAECAAEDKENEEHDIEAYVAYIGSADRKGPAADRVYALVRDMCQITEGMRPQQRRPAVALLRRILAVNSGLEWAHYFMGLSQLLDGRAAEALEEFTKASELNDQRALTFYWLAVCHLQTPGNTLEPAIERIERFLSFNLTEGKSRAREARVCTEIVKRLIERVGGERIHAEKLDETKRQNLSLAAHYLDIALERRPEDGANWFLLARVLRLQGNGARALEALEKAAAKDCTRPEQYEFELGMLLHLLQRNNEAIAALRRTIEIDSQNDEAHRLLGEILFDEGRYVEALPELEAALRADKRGFKNLALLLRALYATDDCRRAIDLIEEHGVEPGKLEDKDALIAVARSYQREGRDDEAVRWLPPSSQPDAL